jgi:hypothetical protein
MITWSDNKVRELIAVKVLYTSLLNITVVAFKVLSLGSYAPMPAPSRPFKTILEMVLCNGLQSCRLTTTAATEGTRWRVRELYCQTSYMCLLRVVEQRWTAYFSLYFSSLLLTSCACTFLSVWSNSAYRLFHIYLCLKCNVLSSHPSSSLHVSAVYGHRQISSVLLKLLHCISKLPMACELDVS